MHRITKNIWIKKEILNYLDQQNNYISTSELSEALKHTELSVSTLYKLCNELKEEIQNLYPADQMALDISLRHGLYLKRKNASFQAIIENLFMKDPFYLILNEVFQNRQFKTAHFCIKFHMSESQLRRRVKQINQLLNHHHLHISVSKNVTLRGEEHRCRYFYFQILLFVHQEFGNISWVDRPHHYLETLDDVLDKLALSLPEEEQEILAIWFYVNDCSNQRIHLNSDTKELISIFPSISRPSFMYHWGDDDWLFFTFFLYSSTLFGLNLPFDEQTPHYQSMKPSIHLWILVFSTHYHVPTEDYIEVASHLIYKHFLYTKLFASESWIFSEPDDVFFSLVQDNFPNYYRIFSQFYDQYEQNDFTKLEKLSRRESLMVCTNLIEIDAYLPDIHVYLYSGHDPIMHSLIKNKIQAYFSNRVTLKFDSRLEESDLLITTSNCHSDTIETVVIDQDITKNDILSIEHKINDFIYSNYA
ncbi:helix-turn-helix domain-containing protein [Enterococcus sp. LJL98]